MNGMPETPSELTQVVPLCRSSTGMIEAILHRPDFADLAVAALGRSRFGPMCANINSFSTTRGLIQVENLLFCAREADCILGHQSYVYDNLSEDKEA